MNQTVIKRCFPKWMVAATIDASSSDGLYVSRKVLIMFVSCHPLVIECSDLENHLRVSTVEMKLTAYLLQ